ncbi:MAG: hypothetical protein DMF49_10770 [Acidobacteria bacterium]|nr:MAG: hypothetical protein DMF49_10770 [Acidobacteriota bacterium]
MGFLEKQSTEALLRELEHHREAVRNFYDRVFGFLSQPSLEGTDPDPLLDPLPEHTLSALVGRPGASGAEESLRLFKRIRRIFSSEQIRPSERRGVRRVSSSILEEVTSAPEPNRVFSNLERFLSSLLLEPTARRAFFEKAEWIPPLIRLLAKSEHLALVLTGHPQILEELGNVPDALRDASFEDLAAPLERDLKNTAELREVAALLRRFHRRQVLFTGLRDVHRQDSLSRTLRRLTALAQACLVGAERAASRIAPAAKQEPRFCVLGLGRLGYHELDYNSDLDLIFVMEPTDDSAALENSRRRAESLIHLLTAITQDGTLYSVDLRLRPAGGEGELIQTSNGLQDYFRDSAQTWEKMALLKARPVAGDVAFGRELLLSLEETMFRGIRQSCLGAEVREMKEKLELSVGGKGGEGLSLKLGPGGLLEVHFIIEYLQLWHGVPGPNDRDTLRMLTYLHGRQLLPAADYHALYAAYLLLRSLDHSIRVLYDRPGDSLPLSRNHLARLASEVSYTLSSSQEATADSLLELVHESCASVRAAFHRLIP